MTTAKFKIGDIVTLNHGGARYTIINTISDNKFVIKNGFECLGIDPEAIKLADLEMKQDCATIPDDESSSKAPSNSE